MKIASEKTSLFFSDLSAAGTVPRVALIQKMKDISARKNIYLWAPGGYGKTIAAAQWANSVRGKTVKITVGESDNVPDFFYKRLALSLFTFA